MAVTLREVFVKLGLDVDAQSFAKGELTAHGVEKAMESVVDKVKEVISTFVENVKAVAEYGETIHSLAQQAGLGTDELQQLGKAAAQEGIGIDSFAHSIVLLSRSMVAAKKDGGEAKEAFKGVRITDAQTGQLRSAGDVFQDLADKFQKMPDGAEKSALAMKLFGRAGAEMIPVLNKGGSALEEFRKKNVMSEEQLQAGREVVVTQRLIAAETRALWRDAIAPLLPALSALLKRFLEWKRANADIMRQRIAGFVGGIIKIIGIAGDAFGVFVRNIDAIKIGLTALVLAFAATHTAAVGAALAVGRAWLAAAWPFVLIGGLIAGFLLVLDDIRMSERNPKAHTLWNLWKKNIDEWTKPHSGDPWWLAAIRDFVGFIRAAVHELDNFSAKVTNVWGKAKAAGGKAYETYAKFEAPLERFVYRGAVAAGEAVRSIVAPAATAAEAPTYTPAAGAGGSKSVSATQQNFVTVHAAEGMSAEDVGAEVARQLEQKWDGHMEEAAAAVGGP